MKTPLSPQSRALSAAAFSLLAATRQAASIPGHHRARRRVARLAEGFLRRDLPGELLRGTLGR